MRSISQISSKLSSFLLALTFLAIPMMARPALAGVVLTLQTRGTLTHCEAEADFWEDFLENHGITAKIDICVQGTVYEAGTNRPAGAITELVANYKPVPIDQDNTRVSATRYAVFQLNGNRTLISETELFGTTYRDKDLNINMANGPIVFKNVFVGQKCEEIYRAVANGNFTFADNCSAVITCE